jgi:hypothetical protein
MMNNHEEFLNHCIELAIKFFKEKGELWPTFIGIKKNGEQLLIISPWSNDEEKRRAVDVVRLHFVATDVQEYVFMCEAWFKTTQDKDWRPTGSLEQEPDRMQALVIVQGWKEEGQINLDSKMFKIHDDKTIDDFSTKDAKAFEGTFTELLPPKQLTEGDIALAKHILKQMPPDYIPFMSIHE